MLKKKSFWALAIAALAIPATGFAQDATTPIIDETLSGDMVLTGNAIGLSYDKYGVPGNSGMYAVDAPGTYNSIGTFLATDANLRDADTCSTTDFAAQICYPQCLDGDTACTKRVSDPKSKSWSDWVNALAEEDRFGMTEDWTKNGSMAVLDLPDGAIVKKAVLIWGASYKQNTQKDDSLQIHEDVSAHIGDAITFRSEHGDKGKTTVLPSESRKIDDLGGKKYTQTDAMGNPIEGKENSIQSWHNYYYLNHADVTEFVAAHGGGAYSVNGIPAVQGAGWSAVNGGGWTLAVVYSLPSGGEVLPMRNITLFVGDRFVRENEIRDFQFKGLCTPSSGKAVTGKLFLGALEGDANNGSAYIGDSVRVATSQDGLNSVAALHGVNNAKNNFFASQINTQCGIGADGEVECSLDKRGTAGTRNHEVKMDASYQTTSGDDSGLLDGARQGWDITTLSLPKSSNWKGVNSAWVQVYTAYDSLVPVLVGFQIDTNAPNFEGSTIALSNGLPMPGNGFDVTVHLSNEHGIGASKNTVVAFYVTKEIAVEGAQCDLDVASGLKRCDVDAGEIAVKGSKDIALHMSIPADAINDDNHGEFTVYAQIGYTPDCVDGDSTGGGFVSLASLVHDWKYVWLDAQISSEYKGNLDTEYTITITNPSHADADGLTLDLGYPGATYVTGSLAIDGVAQDDGAGNPFDSESLIGTGTLAAGESVSVTFTLHGEADATYTVTATADPDGSGNPFPATTVSTETSHGSCGNGIKNSGEECDLAAQNGVEGSGCTADCRIADGSACVEVEGTQHCGVDSDSDGLPDSFEDKDGDGVVDDDETDPRDADTDGDGLCDGNKAVDGVCTAGEDKDGDGVVDDDETDPKKPDTDGDGLCDGANPVDGACKGGEDKNGNGNVDNGETDPKKPDTDGDGIPDGIEDKNGNGTVDDGETDPRNADTDGDGLCDGSNAVAGKCAAGEDKNNDGVVDKYETDPKNPDTDGGGVNDGTEVLQNHTDPLRKCDDTNACGGNGNGEGGNGEGEGGDNQGGDKGGDAASGTATGSPKAVADDGCGCQTVLVERGRTQSPILAALLALFGAILIAMRRRRQH